MKVVAFGALALCFVLPQLSAQPAEGEPPPRLAGIVSLTNRLCAVLEFSVPRVPGGRWSILSERQEDEGVRVVRIAADKGSVDLLCDGTNHATVRLQTATNLPVPAVVLEDAGLSVVLDLFAWATNRTLLRWPALPASSFSLCAVAKTQPGAARILEQALIAEDLAIIPDGDKFVMIVPKSEAATVKPRAPRSTASTDSGSKAQEAAPDSRTATPESLPPGMIDFRDAAVVQVADIYAMMLGRRLDHSLRLPVGGTISLTTRGRLTEAEALYAVETLLRWSGIKLVPAGEGKLKAVRAQEN